MNMTSIESNFRQRSVAGTGALLLLLLFLSLALLSGCLVRVAYSNADVIIRWELNRYFDLETEQVRLLEARLPNHLSWHRTQELPRTIAMLQRTRSALDDGLTDDELVRLYDDIGAMNQALVERLLTDGVELFAQLSDEQVEHLQRKLADANEEWEERLKMPPDARREERLERILDQVEDWVGDVDDAQRDALIEAAGRIPDTLEVWLTHRKARQRRFVELVRLSRSNSAAARGGFQQYFAEPMPAVFTDHRNAVHAFILTVDRLSNAKQRAHAQRRLQVWIDDLDTFTKTRT